jgi:hypothetical protein
VNEFKADQTRNQDGKEKLPGDSLQEGTWLAKVPMSM